MPACAGITSLAGFLAFFGDPLSSKQTVDLVDKLAQMHGLG